MGSCPALADLEHSGRVAGAREVLLRAFINNQVLEGNTSEICRLSEADRVHVAGSWRRRPAVGSCGMQDAAAAPHPTAVFRLGLQGRKALLHGHGLKLLPSVEGHQANPLGVPAAARCCAGQPFPWCPRTSFPVQSVMGPRGGTCLCR